MATRYIDDIIAHVDKKIASGESVARVDLGHYIRVYRGRLPSRVADEAANALAQADLTRRPWKSKRAPTERPKSKRGPKGKHAVAYIDLWLKKLALRIYDDNIDLLLDTHAIHGDSFDDDERKRQRIAKLPGDKPHDKSIAYTLDELKKALNFRVSASTFRGWLKQRSEARAL